MAALQFLLNFFFNRKKNTTEAMPPDSEATRLLYLTAEFESLGDMTKNQHMGKGEFVRLMMLLGYPGDMQDVEKLWTASGQPDDGQMNLDEYITLMLNTPVGSKTDMWRKLFSQFDWDGTGYATKAEVLQGLENIGLDVTPEMRTRLASIDSNKDGQISYAEFLKKQLKQ